MFTDPWSKPFNTPHLLSLSLIAQKSKPLSYLHTQPPKPELFHTKHIKNLDADSRHGE